MAAPQIIINAILYPLGVAYRRIVPPQTLSPVTEASRTIRASSSPVVASQRRAVWSYEAVTMRAPSGEKDALDTGPHGRATR